jgi:transposase-like protein
MEKQQKKSKRTFTPEQKLAILQQIEQEIKSGKTATEAVEKQGLAYSLYRKWKSQLAVGVKSSLRNGKPPVDKEKKRLQQENERLKGIILSQSQMIADLKKETNWD